MSPPAPWRSAISRSHGSSPRSCCISSVPPGATADERELLLRVDWIAHGYEIVQSHFPNWTFRAADAIAAFGLHGALVVGPKQPIDELADVVRKLRTFTITLAKDGKVEADGRPFAEWPAVPAVVRANTGGRVGDHGTLTSPAPIRAGETWHTELSGIGLPGLQLHLT